MEPEHFCDNCDECYFTDLGILGRRQHVRCRACGWDQSWLVEEDDDGTEGQDRESYSDTQDRDSYLFDGENDDDCDDDGRFSTDAEADEDVISADGQPDEAQEWFDFDPEC